MSARSNTCRWAVISLLLVITCSRAFAGKTLYVDDDGSADFNNIQAAIDDSNDGDIVIVAAGTYTGEGNRDIDFTGKAITVRSEKGPENCVIDCNGTEEEPHRGFYFYSGERQDSVLEDFTITNGFAGRGGAIYCDGSSPTIRNCTIISSSARLWDDGGYGGGICCTSSDVVIKNCKIINNIALPGMRAGARGLGGGVFCSSGSPTIANCEIYDNCKGSSSAWLSGAIHSSMSDITISNCRFNNNESNGIYVSGGISKVKDCLIANSKYSGIRCRNGNEAIVKNCRILENRAKGINCDASSEMTVIDQCLIAANIEGGINSGGTRGTRLTSCILWNGGNEISNWEDSIITVKYSNIQGGWPGEGNINEDPLFAAPGYWAYPDDTEIAADPNDPNAIWVEGDYHLKSQAGRWDPNSQSWIIDDVTSPCIDAGDPNSPIGHEPFPNGGIINMGAYGGTSEASKSYFGRPACETIIAGDINGDCKVDFKDFAIMALHWLEER